MTQRHYTLTETLSVIEDLDHAQLDRYIRAGVVVPVQSETGPLFRELDLARLHLVVDLTEGYHLDEEALGLVMSAIGEPRRLARQLFRRLGLPKTKADVCSAARNARIDWPSPGALWRTGEVLYAVSTPVPAHVNGLPTDGNGPPPPAGRGLS